MMFTNYMQHVECDVGSEHNHSRNFVDPLVNWFVFDAGYHTVHHESPGLHWSEYRALHTSLGDAIAPELNQRTILHYILSRYFSDRTPRVARTAV
jgi:fatty acid desaturase